MLSCWRSIGRARGRCLQLAESKGQSGSTPTESPGFLVDPYNLDKLVLVGSLPIGCIKSDNRIRRMREPAAQRRLRYRPFLAWASPRQAACKSTESSAWRSDSPAGSCTVRLIPRRGAAKVASVRGIERTGSWRTNPLLHCSSGRIRPGYSGYLPDAIRPRILCQSARNLSYSLGIERCRQKKCCTR